MLSRRKNVPRVIFPKLSSELVKQSVCQSHRMHKSLKLRQDGRAASFVCTGRASLEPAPDGQQPARQIEQKHTSVVGDQLLSHRPACRHPPGRGRAGVITVKALLRWMPVKTTSSDSDPAPSRAPNGFAAHNERQPSPSLSDPIDRHGSGTAERRPRIITCHQSQLAFSSQCNAMQCNPAIAHLSDPPCKQKQPEKLRCVRACVRACLFERLVLASEILNRR